MYKINKKNKICTGLNKVLLATVLSSASLSVWAQEGILKGRVVDVEGNPIPGAVVNVLEGSRIALSDENGYFQLKKVVPNAPDEVLLVLDGSTGQNAFEQAKQFTLATEVTAMAITKLDGTAKGGVVIGISDQFKIPVKYIGLGEGMEDLQVFRKNEFVDSLFGENA